MNTPSRPVNDPRERFSQRVADYVKARPSYPRAALDCLRDEFGLRREHVIADVGAGTGIATGLLLERGCTVYAVEPNAAMRAEAESALRGNPRFRSVAASAEATTLPPRSVDWVVAAQAFHWFDPDGARREFSRILRPGGNVALLWNDRREDTPLMSEYEDFVQRFGIDYEQIKHQGQAALARIDRLFRSAPPEVRSFVNIQRLDLDGLIGRAASSSYLPGRGHPRYNEMVAALGELFARHQHGGEIAFEYATRLHVGRVENGE